MFQAIIAFLTLIALDTIDKKRAEKRQREYNEEKKKWKYLHDNTNDSTKY